MRRSICVVCSIETPYPPRLARVICAGTMANEKQWLPLESNPDVMNDYCRRCEHAATLQRPPAERSHSLGVPSTWAFHDVYGFDAELLAMARAQGRRCCGALTALLRYLSLCTPCCYCSP